MPGSGSVPPDSAATGAPAPSHLFEAARSSPPALIPTSTHTHPSSGLPSSLSSHSRTPRSAKRISVQSALSADSVPEADEDDPALLLRGIRSPPSSRPHSRAASPSPQSRGRQTRSRPTSMLSTRPTLTYSSSYAALPSLATSSGAGSSALYASHPQPDRAPPHTGIHSDKLSFTHCENLATGVDGGKPLSAELAAKRADKRWRIALEFRESERTYAAVLDDIHNFYHQPLLLALPLSEVPLARRAAVRASQASSVSTAHPHHPSQAALSRSRPQSMVQQISASMINTLPARSSSLGPPVHLPTSSPAEPASQAGLEQPPGQCVLSHATLEAIFSNLTDVRSLSALILEALDREVPDMPSKPVTLPAQPNQASLREASASPVTPDQHTPGLSSSAGTIDSTPSPPTPEQSVDHISTPLERPAPARAKSKRRSLAESAPPPLALGRALLPLLPFLKSTAQFVANFDRSTATLAALRVGQPLAEGDDCPAFAAFLRERALIERGVGLGGLLLNIVQRVPRYRYLLADLLEYTDPGHPDFGSLQAAYALADEVASHLESSLGQKGEDAKMLKLARAFAGRGLDGRSLVEPGRKLIRAGRLRKLDRKGNEQHRLFFLFSDMLLHASIEGDWLGFQMDGGWVDLEGSFRVRQILALEHVTVVGAEDRSGSLFAPSADGSNTAAQDPKSRRHVFEMLAPEKSFALFADSAKDKDDWIDAIREAKAGLMSDRRTLQRVDTSTSLGSKSGASSRVKHASQLSMTSKRDRRISLPAPASPGLAGASRPSAQLVQAHRNKSSISPALNNIPGPPSPLEMSMGLLGHPLLSSPKCPSPLASPAPGSVRLPRAPGHPRVSSAEDYFALPRAATPSNASSTASPRRVECTPTSRTPLSAVGGASLTALFVMDDYSAPVWVPDNAAERCANCQETFFGAWRRKHHCRLCGDVVCWACSQRQFVIPAVERAGAGAGQDEGEERVARCCERCWDSVVLPRSSAAQALPQTPSQRAIERASPAKSAADSLSKAGGTVVAEFVQPRMIGKGTVRTRLRSFKR